LRCVYGSYTVRQGICYAYRPILDLSRLRNKERGQFDCGTRNADNSTAEQGTRTMMRFGAVLLLAVALAAAGASRAEASFIAYACNDPLCQGTGDFIVADGSGSDLDASSGLILNNASTGGLSVLVTTSKPATGNALDPQMHLSFVASGVGSAWLYVVDTDYLFTPGVSGLYGGVNGTNSSVQYGVFSGVSNSSNLPLDLSKGKTSPVLPSSTYSGSLLLGPFNPTPYSLTLMAAITRGPGAVGTSSGDFDITAAPEPTSMALLGLGLVAVAAGARRLRRNRRRAAP
jgi:hypothetical protein